MLDVYRTYYQLTGEPFRLGPDHRFSLHHSSYANAKAYLEFAIYQGEGFIAITGGPGTGKTTLISEILATLDRGKIEIATLNSTQLESRDLLQMVASSFGLHPEKINKADLLLEIEAFLIIRVRSGHRAILIVDEAQGLSPGALEELRLLANLQFQYQLLLQIVLVGQERLLELIRSPGMEHLRQRLVAATSLEPLGLDETIDYIEHRLKRVGWQGDPALDERALRLLYRYSGGIPRRINLIANRLFLYGGMQEKHVDRRRGRCGRAAGARRTVRDPLSAARPGDAVRHGAGGRAEDAGSGDAGCGGPGSEDTGTQSPGTRSPGTRSPGTQSPGTGRTRTRKVSYGRLQSRRRQPAG
jgi:type II secretory pathway predicted ATPase ExeA